MSWDQIDVEEVYMTLRKREKQIPLYYNRSLQLNKRPFILEWMWNTCDVFELQGTTLHLAVSLLDYFMDSYSVHANHLMLLCIACIKISGKLTSSS